VDARLLAGADADGLAARGERDGVGLRVFQGNRADDQVPDGLFRQILVPGHDVLTQVRPRHGGVAGLFEPDAINLARLVFGRLEVGVNLQDQILPAALGLEDLERVGVVVRGDAAVGDLAGEDFGGASVKRVGEGGKVAETRHAVRPAGTSVGDGQRRKIVHVVNEARLLLRV